MFRKVQALLDGKKTYIGIIAGLAYSTLVYFKVVPYNQMVVNCIGGWTGISAVAHITKSGM